MISNNVVYEHPTDGRSPSSSSYQPPTVTDSDPDDEETALISLLKSALMQEEPISSATGTDTPITNRDCRSRKVSDRDDASPFSAKHAEMRYERNSPTDGDTYTYQADTVDPSQLGSSTSPFDKHDIRPSDDTGVPSGMLTPGVSPASLLPLYSDAPHLSTQQRQNTCISNLLPGSGSSVAYPWRNEQQRANDAMVDQLNRLSRQIQLQFQSDPNLPTDFGFISNATPLATGAPRGDTDTEIETEMEKLRRENARLASRVEVLEAELKASEVARREGAERSSALEGKIADALSELLTKSISGRAKGTEAFTSVHSGRKRLRVDEMSD